MKVIGITMSPETSIWTKTHKAVRRKCIQMDILRYQTRQCFILCHWVKRLTAITFQLQDVSPLPLFYEAIQCTLWYYTECYWYCPMSYFAQKVSNRHICWKRRLRIKRITLDTNRIVCGIQLLCGVFHVLHTFSSDIWIWIWKTLVLFVGPLIPVMDLWWCLPWVSKQG